MLGHIMEIVSEMQSKEMRKKKPTSLDLYIFWALAIFVCMVVLSFVMGTN